MAHILHTSEWESNGKYLVSDIDELGKGSGTWWYVANLLSLSPIDYVNLLIKDFHAIDLQYKYEYDVLIFYFSSLEHARRFKNYVNKVAREKNFMICG